MQSDAASTAPQGQEEGGGRVLLSGYNESDWADDGSEDYYEDYAEWDDHVDALNRGVSPAAAGDARAASGKTLQPRKHQLATVESKIRTGKLRMETTHMRVPHAVESSLRKHEKKQQSERLREKDKSDRATSEQVLDNRTRIIIYKMIKAEWFAEMHGCISTGKEANVYYCENVKTEGEGARSPYKQLALKVFKTSILVFKDRDRYVTGEFRFRRGYSKSNPRKMVKLWAEKEYRNLLRLRRGGLNAPEPLLVKSHLLLMSFLGKEGWPSPRLKDASLSQKRLQSCYRQLVLDMRRMFHDCRLVHADLSEYNILYHKKELWIIDVSQSVEHDHPHALEFLRMDCRNVTTFFAGRVAEPDDLLRVKELFDFVCDPLISKPKEHLEQLLDSIAGRPPMTEAEKADENVFQDVFIPRTLEDVADPAGDQADARDDPSNTLHAAVTGMRPDMMGAKTGEAVQTETHEEDVELHMPDDGDMEEVAREADDGEEKQSGEEEAEEEVENAGDKTQPPNRKKMTKEEYKQWRKENKKKVKTEQRENRKKKIPKHVKKRAIKQNKNRR